jgi:hypothetical protein
VSQNLPRSYEPKWSNVDRSTPGEHMVSKRSKHGQHAVNKYRPTSSDQQVANKTTINK